MKYLIILLLCVSCSGKAKKQDGTRIPDISNNVSEVCINSHIYYLYSERMAIRLNDNGWAVKCVKLKKGVK